MAKESMKAKERKRERLAAQYAEKREILRKAHRLVLGVASLGLDECQQRILRRSDDGEFCDDLFQDEHAGF